MRKLASVQRVAALDPIPGADSIERATVMGWGVVVKRGDFKVGDRCVFFEIDSLLPADAPWAQFMKPRGFRVKTVKLRGCLSQGLALRTDILSSTHELEDDVTDELGVSKYEPPLPESHEIAGVFPGYVPKTDEIRLQSALGLLDEIKERPFYVSMKLDGKSGTFIKKDGQLIVCGRNWSIKEGDNSYWRVAHRYDLASLPEGFAVQGEVCGPKIQKNRLGLDADDLFVFNVYDICRGRYLDYNDFVLFCVKHGLKTVPIMYEMDPLGEDKEFPFTLERFLALAEGFYPGTQNRREGIVVRPLIERASNFLGGSRLSFKVISNSYLLNDEE